MLSLLIPPINRAYLKSVAKKLAEDVDNLKTSASSLGKVGTVHVRVMLSIILVKGHNRHIHTFLNSVVKGLLLWHIYC